MIIMKLIVYILFNLFIVEFSFASNLHRRKAGNVCMKKNRVCRTTSSNPKEICCEDLFCTEFFGFFVCAEGKKPEDHSCNSNNDCDSGICDLTVIPTKCKSNPDKKSSENAAPKSTMKTDKQGRFQLCYYDEDCAFGKCVRSFHGVKYCNQPI